MMTVLRDGPSLEGELQRALASADRLVEQLVRAAPPRTVDNTLVPFDRIQEELGNMVGLALAMRVHPDAAARRGADKVLSEARSALARIRTRSDVFEALASLDLVGVADAEARYYLRRTLADLRREGAEQSDAAKARLIDLNQALSSANSQFQINLAAVPRLEVTPAELEGVPRDFLTALPRLESGRVSLEVSQSNAMMVLSFATSSDLRRRTFEAWRNVAYPENEPLLERMLVLRTDIARTLGHDDWVAYHTSSRMATDASTVNTFLNAVLDATKGKVEAEYRALLSEKRRLEPGATVVADWEEPYLAERVRRRQYDADAQLVRQYFSVEQVIAGLLEVASRLYGVSFRPADVPAWHPSVRAFEWVENGEPQGRFYLDLSTRPGKPGSGASHSPTRTATPRQTAESLIVASFAADTAGRPGLMSHDEVRTLFHEFGHLVQFHSARRSRWYGLNGRPAESDFIEGPSMMFEEWPWDPKVLQLLARHHATGEPLPTALLIRMRRAAEFGKGMRARRNAVFAKIALELHRRPSAAADIHKTVQEHFGRLMPFVRTPGTHLAVGWTHLGNPNYTSAYYTYLWSDVIAKDLLTRFDSSNLLAPGPARRYRDLVLAPGSAKPAAQLIEDFLGRPFTIDAWRRWLSAEMPEAQGGQR